MVYVASHNIVSSLGLSSEENFKAVSENRSGIAEIIDPSLNPEPVFISLTDTEKLIQSFSKISDPEKYTYYEKLLIVSIKDALKTSKVDISNKDTIVLFSTTKGNIDLLKKENQFKFEENRVQLWKSSEIISNFFKNPNKPITVSNACISGTLAVIIAKRLLEEGKYKHAVVTGADILPEFTLSGFSAFKAVSEGACKPFDKNRSGMTPAEGAGTIVLTTDESLVEEPKVFIKGGSSSNDANHISGPSRTGKELAFSINKSIEDAGIRTNEIDYISAHGTATLFNDEMEAKALSLSKLDHVPTNSIKGYLGHTFGAAGIIETIFGIEAIKAKQIYRSPGFEIQGTENKLNIIEKHKISDIKNVLKTASGFGGCNASLILGSENDYKPKKTPLNYNITGKVKIIKNKILINDKDIEITADSELNFNKFMKLAYKYFGIKYPKFYKMEKLCKLAFIASEILLKDINLSDNYKPEDIAVILSNGSSSLDTDLEYQSTIEDKSNYFPSPAVFVYTLANIMAGEICIRNNIKGENTVFISEDFEKDFLMDYVDILFKTGKAKACITGRTDYAYPTGEYFAELYLKEIIK